MTAHDTARQVLRLYRKILVTGRTWPNVPERSYIQSEAARLFRENQDLKTVEAIERKLFEATSRYDLAKFYKIAAPRYFYNQPGTVHKASNKAAPSVTAAYLDSAYADSRQEKTAAPVRRRRQSGRTDRSRHRIPTH
jgi:hypothetical protein